MAESEWGDLQAQFVTTLREQKIEPVPAEIVQLAQKSLDGIPHPDGNPEHKLHSMQWEAGSPERAAAFARHMRNAGPHTTPQSSIVAIIDPDRKMVPAIENGQPVIRDGKQVKVKGPEVNPRLVAFRAGARRGRAAS